MRNFHKSVTFSDGSFRRLSQLSEKNKVQQLKEQKMPSEIRLNCVNDYKNHF